jgi:hypothetical protein
MIAVRPFPKKPFYGEAELGMPENSVWYWATFVLLTLIGFWVLLKMVRAYRLSGFRFYLYSGLILGIPFLVWALIFYYYPKAGIVPYLILFIITRLGMEWGTDQEEKASQAEPEKMEAYQRKVRKLSFIVRNFF